MNLMQMKKADPERFREFSPAFWAADIARLPHDDGLLATRLMEYILDRYHSRPFHRQGALTRGRSDGDHIFKTATDDLYWCVIQPFKNGKLTFHFHDKEDEYQAPPPFSAKWCKRDQGKTKKREKDIVLAGQLDKLSEFLNCLDLIHDNAVVYYGRTKDATKSLRLMFGQAEENRPPLALPDNAVFESILREGKGCHTCGTQEHLSFGLADGHWKLFCDDCHPQSSHWKPKAGVVIPHVVRKHVWHRDGGRCRKCESELQLHFDHVIPRKPVGLSISGSNTENNLVLKCRSCNLTKGNKLVI